MLTEHEIDTLFTGMKAMVEPLMKRVAMLEGAMKQMRTMGFRGVYQRALAPEYRKNSLVTFDGALWFCLKDAPTGSPGQSPDWQLCSKAGR